MSMKTLTRLSYIDILKIVATFAIVLWHVSAVYVRMDAALLSPLGAAPISRSPCLPGIRRTACGWPGGW